ncbi:MAG: xylulokinase [Anaerolineae bacterium]|nr:xylulokinase [Anaerolineae bacterium]MDQ7033821.1 xylulokinase [Anaerolineae bacterium]
MKQYIIAHDLGTTGNKATLYDKEGQLHATTFFGYDTDYSQTNWAEQNPDDWWQAVISTTRQLLAESHVRGDEIACVTFSGQMQGVVAVDKAAKPLRSAIIWADQRATDAVNQLAERISPADVYRITGHRLSAAYSLPKILWIRDHQPDIFAATHKFMHAKDAIIARMTGQFVTDPSDASGMNLYHLEGGKWSDAILQAADLDSDKLPEIRRSIDIAGEIFPDVATEMGLPRGIPVVIGGGDGACASVGAGSVRENIAYTYVGSSAWIARTSRKPIYDPQQRTVTFGHVVPDLFIPMGTMQTAGAAYQWVRDQLAPLEQQAAQDLGISAYTLLNAVAEISPPGANHLLFLPYLLGERAPRWNPDARAVFLGLTIRHTRADMVRSVMEGVAFNLCVILKAMQNQGVTIDSIRAIGGGVSRPFWSSIMADIYGVPLQRLAILESATSMGAAVVGGVGVGLYPDFSIAERMNPVTNTIHPNPENDAVYRQLLAVFENAYHAIEPIFSQLAELQ